MKVHNKNRHLTLRDRVVIQVSLEKNISIAEIAKRIGFSRQKVHQEVLNNCVDKKVNFSWAVNRITCQIIARYPFVCNTCPRKKVCTLKGRYYYADQAHEMARDRLVNPRKKPHLSKEQLASLDDLISPLIKNGQSIHNVYLIIKDKIKICERTIRNLINKMLLTARPGDLRRTNSRKPKPTLKEENKKLNPYLLFNRMYDDFIENEASRVWYVELDTVHGKRADSQAILTIFFPKIGFMFGYLLAKNGATNVNDALLNLRNKIGLNKWSTHFNILLSDRGREFDQLPELEISSEGEVLSHFYYTDPYRATQKAGIESAHRLVRYVIPKSTSLKEVTQDDLNLMFSHINSLKRKSLGDVSPYSLAMKSFGSNVLNAMDIKQIKAKDIYLKPNLIRKKGS